MDKRAKFDFEIVFTNEGSIRGQDFRLDIPGEDITDDALARLLATDMNLLMVKEAKIWNKQVLAEPHKREGSAGPLLVDLSHTIENGLVTYKGLPAPIICDYLSREDSRKFYEPGTEFRIGMIEMVTNTGTYIDFPFHRYAHGKDLSEVGLENLVDLDAVIIRVPYTETLEISESHFKDLPLSNHAVLVHTGWDQHWNTAAYYDDHPYLTQGAAEYLKDQSVKLVGIDGHNIDNTTGRSRPVHSILLGAGILIVEHLCNLKLVPDDGFTFTAIPPKIKGAGTFPVRAMAKIPGTK